MDRVFLDANILFSAAYREGAGLQQLWKISTAKLLTSSYAIEEARRNLGDVGQLARLDSLLVGIELVETRPAASLPHGIALPAKDAPILLAAIAAGATHLLTGDIRHFGPLYGRTIEGTLVLTPAEYVSVRSQ